MAGIGGNGEQALPSELPYELWRHVLVTMLEDSGGDAAWVDQLYGLRADAKVPEREIGWVGLSSDIVLD